MHKLNGDGDDRLINNIITKIPNVKIAKTTKASKTGAEKHPIAYVLVTRKITARGKFLLIIN